MHPREKTRFYNISLLVTKSVNTIMATIFLDIYGIILFWNIRARKTINAVKSLTNLRHHAVCPKHPGWLTKRVILRPGNAILHTARVAQEWIANYGWDILPRSPVQILHCLIIICLWWTYWLPEELTVVYWHKSFKDRI